MLEMESSVAYLKTQVQCSLCNERIVEPKLLECFHTFCQLCIKTNSQLDGQVNVFKCPQCDSLSEFQELNDVDDLQTNPILARILMVLAFAESEKVCSVSVSHGEAFYQCIDCDHSLCEECYGYHSKFTKDHKVVSLPQITKEDIEVLLRKESPCKVHPNQGVEFYCKDCDELICVLCLKGHFRIHKTTSLQEFIASKKDSLSENLQEIEEMVSNATEKQQQEQIAVKLIKDGKIAQEQVKKRTKELVNKLKENEQKLLAEIRDTVTKADRNLRIIRHTEAAKEYVEYFIQNGTASEFIDIKAKGSGKSKLLHFEAFDKNVSGVEYQPNQVLCDRVDTGFGKIKIKHNTPDPNNCSVSVYWRVEATKEATITITLKDGEGNACDLPLDDVEIHVTPEDDVVLGEKYVVSTGLVELSFTPCFPGQLTAEVQVHGIPVANSPLLVDVEPQMIFTDNKLRNALNNGSTDLRRLAVNKAKTKIAVANNKTYPVTVFNMEGDILLEYNNGGKEKGRISSLAFLNDSELVISDYYNHRICVVDTNFGHLLRTFGSCGDRKGQLLCPEGIDVDDDSNIIVCDSNNRIQVFSQYGEYLYEITIPRLGYIYDVVKHNRLMYVSDSSKVLAIHLADNHTPSLVTTIFERENIVKGPSNPYDLALDINHNLLVADYYQNKIHKFSLNGRFIGSTNELDCVAWFLVALDMAR